MKWRVVSTSCKVLTYSETFKLASCMWEVRSLRSYCEEAPNSLVSEAEKLFLTKVQLKCVCSKNCLIHADPKSLSRVEQHHLLLKEQNTCKNLRGLS